MTNKVDATLKQLASISQTLNEASDQLSKQIAEIESALNEYKLGITAWVELKKEKELTEPAEDGARLEVTIVEQLGYGKHKGKWGLLVTSYCEEFDGENSNESFLRDAPRETRLAAVDKLPELLKALAQEGAKVTEEATKKAAQAKEIAAALSKKPR